MLQGYLPVLVFLSIAVALGVILLALGLILGGGQKDKEKLSPYECGFEPFEDSRIKFDVRYYLVAILFIIFDLEIAFLFPVGRIAGYGRPRSEFSRWASFWRYSSSALSTSGKRVPWSGIDDVEPEPRTCQISARWRRRPKRSSSAAFSLPASTPCITGRVPVRCGR